MISYYFSVLVTETYMNILKALRPKPKHEKQTNKKPPKYRKAEQQQQEQQQKHAINVIIHHTNVHSFCNHRQKAKRQRQKASGWVHKVQQCLTRLPLLAGVQDGERFNRERRTLHVTNIQRRLPMPTILTHQYVNTYTKPLFFFFDKLKVYVFSGKTRG